MSDKEVMVALIDQVLLAMSAAAETKPMATERDVLTLISRPMWNAFCRATGTPIHAKPTPWKGSKGTIRVFGSETKIIESDSWWSFSRPLK